MDARHLLAAASAAAVCLSLTLPAQAAQVRTPNFVVEAPTAAIAEQVAESAERYRHDLAIHWLGEPLPKNWRRPCPIRVTVGERLGAGGETSFLFDGGHVFGWDMRIQGTLERVLDSVLPHEVTHTIFASYFRQPLPRWADEGACTTVEHEVERGNHRRMLIEFLHTSRGIAFSQMFAMTEYPSDVLPLYSQGHSLVTFLLQQGGPQKFVQFMEAGLDGDRWSEAVRQHYGQPSLAALQDSWLDWVKQGSPETDSFTDPADGGLLADSGIASESDGLVYRGQNPDEGDATSDAAVAPRPGPAAGEDGESIYEPRRRNQAPEEWPSRSGPTSIRPSPDDDAQPPSEVVGGKTRRVILEWRRGEEQARGERHDEPLRDASQRVDTRLR